MVRIMVSPHRSQNHMGPPPRMVDTHLPPQTIRDDHPANTKGNEMKDSEADIAIGVLNKLIDQELEAVRAATRDGNTPFVGYAQTRHNAFLYARDEIRKALAAAVDERGAGNPFLPQRDELVTMDIHTCDLCGRWCSSPVYSIGLTTAARRRHSPRCAPTACDGSNSSRSKPSRWTFTGFLRSGWTSRRRRSGEQEI